MKIKLKKRKEISFADSGALSDLAFLLIVFFIVIAVFNINKGFMLGLPRKNSSKIVNTRDLIKVQLDNEQLLLKGESVTMEELEGIVREQLKEFPNLTFLLNIAPETRYQRVVNVLDVVQKLDVDNFSFNMDTGGEAAP